MKVIRKKLLITFRFLTRFFYGLIPGVNYFFPIATLMSLFGSFFISKSLVYFYSNYSEFWENIASAFYVAMPPIFVPNALDSSALSAFSLLLFPAIYSIIVPQVALKKTKKDQNAIKKNSILRIIRSTEFLIFNKYAWHISISVVIIIWIYHDIWPIIFSLIITLIFSFVNQHVGFGISSLSDVLALGVGIETAVILFRAPLFFIYLVNWVIFLAFFVTLCMLLENLVNFVSSFEEIRKVIECINSEKCK